MGYASLEACIQDLDKAGLLVQINEEVDPYLELASLQLKLYKNQAPAVLFNNVKGCKYRVLANLFGTLDRCHYMFRHDLNGVQNVIALRNDPLKALKAPFKLLNTIPSALHALPKKYSERALAVFEEVQIEDLPQIHHWKDDGGAFITLPQVYSEPYGLAQIMHSNVGMYRIQLSGNEYVPNKEIGLHYQIHRGIGVHHQQYVDANALMPVSIFIGGPPAHTVSAVMPLPEGISELNFAGVLAGRRFRYVRTKDNFVVSLDADFVITGWVDPKAMTKMEGPFGDHLGYYSLQHPYPVLKVHKVYAKPKGIWPFTVVGRPPQEDTTFGDFIHELTGTSIPKEIPGIQEVHAVDAAGVHPLLLAIGKERYTPFQNATRPAELLTLANRVLGTGQLSLAKYLFITADPSQQLTTKNIQAFFEFVLERVDWKRDVHFQTQTTIDTLDYTGGRLNEGSKVVIAAYGNPIRSLATHVAAIECDILHTVSLVMPGVAAISMEGNKVSRDYIDLIKRYQDDYPSIVLWTVVDDVAFVCENLSNWLWVTFTRSNPATDIDGVEAFYEHKHWGCKGALVIDARNKAHHAPALCLDPATEERVKRFKQTDIGQWL